MENLNNQLESITRFINMVGRWSEVVNYCERENLNPDKVLELLQCGVEIYEKVNSK